MDQKLLVLCRVFVIAGVVFSAPVIKECSSGGNYVSEDTAATFTCRSYGTQMQWYLYDETDETYIGGCNQLNCYFEDSYSYSFNLKATKTQNSVYTSQLEILNVTREQARSLICYVSKTQQNYCKLHVIAPAVVRSENCNVSISNWQVHGTCSVFRMYASNNNYWCAWHMNTNETFRDLGFNSTLKNYTYNSRRYTSGECSFTKEIPVVEGSYTYSLSVFPGFGVYFNDTITIKYPDGPTHDCPQHVFEGSDFNCTCKSTTTGSPPATAEWDGLDSKVLQVKSASRHLNGELRICRLVWGPQGNINRNTSFIVGVAYGPSAVLLNSTQEEAENGSYIVNFTCTAVDVYPSAVFTWNITCLRQTNNTNISTCIVKLTEHEELSVTCTASNAYYKDVFLSQTLVLPISEDEASAIAAGTGSLNGGLIGGVTAAAVVVLVIIAVVAVYIIKRRKDPVYDTARRPANNEHNYVDLAQDRCKEGQPTDASYDMVTRQDGDEHGYVTLTQVTMHLNLQVTEAMAGRRLWITCLVSLLTIEGHSGLTIGGCEQGSVVVTNGTDPSFTCSTSLSNWLWWKIFSEEGTYFGYCNRWGCTPWNIQYTVDVKGSSSSVYTSSLMIKRITGNSTRTLVCSSPGEPLEAWCSLTITDEQFTKENEAKGTGSSVDEKGAIIGGVIGGVVLLAIVITIIVVCILRRKKDPVYDTARRPANNEHHYVDLAQNRCNEGQPTDVSYDMVTRQDGDEHGYVGLNHTGHNASEPADAIFIVGRIPTAP
ncbi:uncharacterized protein LOC112568907 isoform X2 [Pomacea canaliculata]|uniref:uncharacterized protein LOC112568907 isoform X2 n=1 Tax=Pomacea canaliculata TaxID=400727 RepID=UPI000D7275AF|nr:uncharacterized protein LOC112568907 isoform X2 [Pomacea canaliculata]